MGTTENMEAAFAGESQANRKYLAFAEKAEKDGLPQVAKLFRAAAEAETIHAHMHLRALNGIGDTAENVKAAIAGEGFEYTEMYPKFVAEAKAEGHDKGVRNMSWITTVEKVHHDLYTEALAKIEAGGDLPTASIWVCAGCGHTIMGDKPTDKCEVCGAAPTRFFEVQ